MQKRERHTEQSVIKRVEVMNHVASPPTGHTTGPITIKFLLVNAVTN